MNQRGSSLILGLITSFFLVALLAGLGPLVATALKSTSVDRDISEAQYAAEAGAKRAIVGIVNGRTDWAWSLNNYSNPITDGSTTQFVTSISPVINDGTAPIAGKTYTITSKGIVNSVSRTVQATVTSSGSSEDSLFQKGMYSGNYMNIVSGSVTGDISSDGLITVGNGMRVNGNVFYSGSYPVIKGSAGTLNKVDKKIGLIDVISLMKYTPTMPSFSKPTRALPNTNSDLDGNYYQNSSFSNWNYTYTVASNKSVFIYVDGDYTIGTPINGGGNITIYANGNVTVHGNIQGNTVQIYAEKEIKLSQNTIRGNSITLQSKGNFYISGGSVEANTNGTVNIYSGGKIDAGNGSINGSLVTITATTAPRTIAADLHGTNFNYGMPNNITKFYINGGNVDMASGNIDGISMIVTTGSIDSHGTNSSTMLIAGGDIEAESGSSAGLYANGFIYVHGSRINCSDTIPQTLGLLGEGGSEVVHTITWSQ